MTSSPGQFRLRLALSARRRARRGFVLLLTLLLLLVAVALAASLGTRSLRKAVEARQARAQLQRQWGMQSCKSLLPNAESILRSAEIASGKPQPMLSQSVILGGQRFDITLSDEQAKLNINSMYNTLGAATTYGKLKSLLSGVGALRTQGLGVHLAPFPKPIVMGQKLPPFQSFGQFLYAGDPAAIARAMSDNKSKIHWITCWGNGQLQGYRAPDIALQLSGLNVGPNDLSFARSLSPAFLAANGIPGGQQMANGLTATSQCHSIWIVTHDARRTWYSFSVRDESHGLPTVQTFEW